MSNKRKAIDIGLTIEPTVEPTAPATIVVSKQSIDRLIRQRADLHKITSYLFHQINDLQRKIDICNAELGEKCPHTEFFRESSAEPCGRTVFVCKHCSIQF